MIQSANKKNIFFPKQITLSTSPDLPAVATKATPVFGTFRETGKFGKKVSRKRRILQ